MKDKIFVAKCPLCGVITKIKLGMQRAGCSHYRKLELAHENKLMAIFRGDWGVEVKEESNE